MALKGDRLELMTDVSFFGNSVMNRGGIACLSTVGSGGAMDQSQALVAYPANSSGAYPIGVLLNDMVSLDLTRQHMNYYQDQVILGGKVSLGRIGYWVTNSLITGAGAIVVGDVAVLTSSGNFMNVARSSSYNWNYANTPKVGQFMSTADEDGYAKISINLAQ